MVIQQRFQFGSFQHFQYFDQDFFHSFFCQEVLVRGAVFAVCRVVFVLGINILEAFHRERGFGSSVLIFIPIGRGVGFQFPDRRQKRCVDIITFRFVSQLVGVIIGQYFLCRIVAEAESVHIHAVGGIISVLFLHVIYGNGIRNVVVRRIRRFGSCGSSVRVAALVIIPGSESFKVEYVDELLNFIIGSGNVFVVIGNSLLVTRSVYSVCDGSVVQFVVLTL